MTAVRENEHLVQFYEDEAFLLDNVSEFLGNTLSKGGSAIALARSTFLAGLEARLTEAGLDVEDAQRAGRYTTLDAHDVLKLIMDGRQADAGRFLTLFSGVIDDAALAGRPVSIFGELVSLLAEDDNHEAALHIEQLWNDLLVTRTFTLYCAYTLESLGPNGMTKHSHDICGAHTRVVPAESYSAQLTEDDRTQAIVELQAQAAQLKLEIEARQELEKQLVAALAAEQQARQQAETALHQRDEFLSIAAHDLRTPLTVLYGHLQLVLRRLRRDETIDREAMTEALGLVSAQADTLTMLVNQLLDTSRLDQGKLEVHREPADLATLVRQVVERRQPATDKHTITVNAPARFDVQIDSLRMEQVLTNLLDNAIKYSPDGGPIDVTLTMRPDGCTELAVRDRGIGVPPDLCERIFDRFFQVNGKQYRSGLGLGLYISRQIIEQHGGHIYAELPEGGGSRFVILLPDAVPDDD